MTRRQLIALALVLAALLATRVAVHSQRGRSAAHPEQAGLGRVLPDEVDPASVRWVKVSGPAPASGEPSPALELVKVDDRWTLASANDAPAETAAVEDFVRRVTELRGEVRGEGEAALPRFGLGPDAAAQVELGPERGKAVARIWIGKQGDDASAHFARAEGQPLIRHCRNGLRGPLQMWSDPPRPAPDAFLDKNVLGLDAATVQSVTVERPDATIAISRVSPESATGPGGASGPPAPAAAPAWTATAQGLTWSVQSDALDGVVSRASSARASRALPPGTAACASDAMATRVRFARGEGQGEVVALVGPRLPGSDDVAVRLEGGATCYAFGGFAARSLAVRASLAWSIPEIFLETRASEDPQRVRVLREGRSFELRRDAQGAWSLAGGSSDAAACARLVSAFREARLEDAAELSRVPPSALVPACTISADVGGRRLELQVLGERPDGSGDRYARNAGGATVPAGWIGVVSSATASSLLVSEQSLRGGGEGAGSDVP